MVGLASTVNLIRFAQVSPGQLGHNPREKMPRSDETKAMLAYASGDMRAFDTLFELFAPRLLLFFRRAFPDPTVAEDLLQLTFERIHRARGSFRDGAPVRPWIYTIAARVRDDELRRRYRVPKHAADDELDRIGSDGVSPHAELDCEERARVVRGAIEQLPASQRTVIHLHRFEGLTFSEISEVLGVKEGAVRVRAFRAYETLRERLRPLVQGGEQP